MCAARRWMPLDARAAHADASADGHRARDAEAANARTDERDRLDARREATRARATRVEAIERRGEDIV